VLVECCRVHVVCDSEVGRDCCASPVGNTRTCAQSSCIALAPHPYTTLWLRSVTPTCKSHTTAAGRAVAAPRPLYTRHVVSLAAAPRPPCVSVPLIGPQVTCRCAAPCTRAPAQLLQVSACCFLCRRSASGGRGGRCAQCRATASSTRRGPALECGTAARRRRRQRGARGSSSSSSTAGNARSRACSWGMRTCARGRRWRACRAASCALSLRHQLRDWAGRHGQRGCWWARVRLRHHQASCRAPATCTAACRRLAGHSCYRATAEGALGSCFRRRLAAPPSATRASPLARPLRRLPATGWMPGSARPAHPMHLVSGSTSTPSW
jgi:hypothetical protein